MPFTKKAMVLFEPEKYRRLKEIARKQNISVGEIIRKAIDEMVLKRAAEDERLEAAKRLTVAEEDCVEWAEIEKIIAKAHVG
jgi:intein/homing endonuclease